MGLSDNERGGLLLVEDDQGICELEAQRLEPLGLPIRRANSSEEGRAALVAGPSPELMLVDYSLPGQTALEFINGLRAAGVAVPPFLVVTGRGDEAVAVASMKAGACDYLVKNADFLDSLLPSVRKALERTELQRQLDAARESTAKNLHLYTFLAQVNIAAAMTKDRRELYRKICDIAVSAGMRMAWIGLLDADLGRITPFCWNGVVDGYLDGIRIQMGSDLPEANGPTGTAASTLRICPCADIAHDPRMEPWRAKALARGYRSSAAIPLEEGGRLSAVLTLYSGESGFFTGDELRLLEEIKLDISLALEAISAEEKRAYAQAALERTAADLAHIMDVTPVMLFRLRVSAKGEGVLEWVSGNAGAITGYTPEEALKPGWVKENMHPDDRAASGTLGASIPSGNLVRDFRFRRKNGDYFWVHAQLKLSKEYGGEITGSWTDITPLKESETRFQELFEKAPIGYLSTDEKGALLAVNDTWCEVFGREREGAIGAQLRSMIVPESLALFDKYFGRLVGEGGAGSFELEITRPDGVRRWLSFSVRTAGKDVTCLRTHCIFSDITIELAQRKQMRLLNDAIGASFDEIYIFDPGDFHFIFLNQAALKNLGYTEAEARRLTPWDLKREFTEASFRRAVAPLLNREETMLLFESAHSRKDGSTYPVEIRLQLVESGEDRFFLAVIKDITERRKNDALLAEMANMQRVESLGALAGGIAHDFNNMLTGIMANLSLLAAKPGGENNDIIHEALEAARGAQSLTSQLLAFSKGGKPLKKEFCLARSLKEIFSLATRGSSAAKGLSVPEDLWGVDGDEAQIKQAVNNLLVNALQAMPSGGLISLAAENVELSGSSGALPPGNYVRIKVSDTGIGIPAEYLKHVFEPYFTTKAKGHGLGLSMTWFVIKNHGGTIDVSSDPGKGTRFEICLPATGHTALYSAAAARPAEKGSGRVLLLEDEELVVKAALRMLGELGYAVEVVPDGRAALHLYESRFAAGRPFDVVIMDLTIPGGMGGKEAGRKLRQLHPEAVIIVSSGYSDEPVMADYKAFGFDAVLPKPYRYEDLAETLVKLLRKG